MARASESAVYVTKSCEHGERTVVAFMLVEAAGLRWRAFAVATARETAAELTRAAMFAELVVGRAREAECREAPYEFSLLLATWSVDVALN